MAAQILSPHSTGKKLFIEAADAIDERTELLDRIKALEGQLDELRVKCDKGRVLLDKETKSSNEFQKQRDQAHAALRLALEALDDERYEIIRGGRHHVEERRMGILNNTIAAIKACGVE